MAEVRNETTDAKRTPGDTRPLATWDPFGAMRSEIESVFDRFGGQGFGRPFAALSGPGAFSGRDGAYGLTPSTDIHETETEISIAAELPGMSEDDIDISISGGVLTIRGEKHSQSDNDGDTRKTPRMVERSYGLVQRSFRLPESVDEDGVTASFKNGVLTVTAPKSSEAPDDRRRIEIKGG